MEDSVGVVKDSERECRAGQGLIQEVTMRDWQTPKLKSCTDFFYLIVCFEGTLFLSLS